MRVNHDTISSSEETNPCKHVGASPLLRICYACNHFSQSGLIAAQRGAAPPAHGYSLRRSLCSLTRCVNDCRLRLYARFLLLFHRFRRQTRGGAEAAQTPERSRRAHSIRLALLRARTSHTRMHFRKTDVSLASIHMLLVTLQGPPDFKHTFTRHDKQDTLRLMCE